MRTVISILALMILVACQTGTGKPSLSTPTTGLVEGVVTSTPSATTPMLPPTAMATTASTPASPTEPAITASFDHLLQSVPHSIDVVYVRDGYAYLNVGPILVILDVSNRQSPRPLGAIKLPVETIFNLYVADGYAYVTAAECGLRIVDVSNPAQPLEVGAYYPPLMGEIAGFPSSEGLPPSYLFHSQGARAVVVDQVAGQVYAYVAALGAGLRVVNVSAPTQPVEVGVLTTSEGGFVDVIIANGHAYLAKPGVGVQIVDISKPTTPQAASLASLEWPNEIWSLSLATNQADTSYVYGAAGTCMGFERSCLGVLHVIDVANPAASNTFSSSRFDGYSTNLAVSNQHAYLLARSGLLVLDVSDPTQPQYKTLLRLNWTKDITVAGDTLYVAVEKCRGQCRKGSSRDGSLQIFDLANPAAPVLVSQWQPVEEAIPEPEPTVPTVEPDTTGIILPYRPCVI